MTPLLAVLVESNLGGDLLPLPDGHRRWHRTRPRSTDLEVPPMATGPTSPLPPTPLIPKAAAALDRAMAIDGKSRTDVVNRALQVYAWIREQQRAGHDLALTVDGGARVVEIGEVLR